MSLSDRDRKLLIVLVPIMVLGAYWFLLLAPKREQAATAATELAVQEQRRDTAQARVDQLDSARNDFAADYAELVRLGKAVPPSVDMPTLLVQLDAAANGTDISFVSIRSEGRVPAAAPVATPGGAPVEAGGDPAQSAPGTAVESANGAAATSDQASSAAEQSGVDASDTQTSEQAREGALPVGGGSVPTSADGTTGTGVPGLDTVPLTFEFTGDFFDLAAFFHRVKRYVEVSREDDLYVRGRLLTIDGMSFASSDTDFPNVTATLTATAYLAPKSEGVTAGATPSGPAVTPAGATAATPGATPPTAIATPR